MQIARLFIRLHLPFHVRKIGKTFGPRPQGTAQQKEPREYCILGAPAVKEAATYSPALHCSTIGASGLNFSVRNGKRWDPTAITT